MKFSRAACACTALRKASRAVTRLYDEAMADTGMSVIQFSILCHLGQHGPLPLMELADLLVMERTTLYRALNPLRRRNWVLLSDGTARAKSASLAAGGTKALAAATGAWEAAQEGLLERLGLEEWMRLESSLTAIVTLATGHQA